MTLMAVTAFGGTAYADRSAQVAVAPKIDEAKPAQPAPIQPRLLRCGTPAAGNVMKKSYGARPVDNSAFCTLVRTASAVLASFTPKPSPAVAVIEPQLGEDE
jgi:hypothetical protein